jgi:ubiquinone/menaquinone biosynthesis C-methylase UbiE
VRGLLCYASTKDIREKIFMDHLELKKFYKNTFNAVSDGYGHSAMRFFSESAKQVSSYLNLNGDEHVLDVATGTGYAALAIARRLPYGQVTGIDFSKGMLSQAMKNKNGQGIHNVTFTEMDMQAIDFQDNYFDVAIIAFSIFFVEDMVKQLIHIAEKVKDSGTILITTFFDNAFAPLVNLFINRLEKYGVKVPSLAWKRVATNEQCSYLFKEAGLKKIKCEQKECGYYLRDASDWWYLIWNGGFRGLVNQLPQNDFLKFKEEHLSEVKKMQSDKGIWLEMSILYTIGEK